MEGSYMKEDEKTGIVRQIVNLLAEKKCTAQGRKKSCEVQS